MHTEIKTRKKYLEQVKQRYQKATKQEKKIILDEVTKTTGYGRKHAIVLTKVCTLLNWINSKRIQPEIAVAIDSLVAAGELVCTKEQRKKLIKISPATIDRLLKTYKKRPVGKGKSYTKPGTLLKKQIPVRTFADWNEKKVGFFEIDLCGHDGGLAKGDFVWTLNFAKVKVQWTEQVAVFNKAQKHVFAGIKTIRGRLPFPLLGYDSDSGSEFINHQLYRYSIQEEKIKDSYRHGSIWGVAL